MQMADDRAECAFSLFLEDRIYDEAEEALFQMLRKAFLAGWTAAKRERIIILTDQETADTISKATSSV